MTESIQFNKMEHHFYVSSERKLKPSDMKLPLSVTLQVTRNCNLNCVYCSETGVIPNPPITSIKKMLSNLRGVKRIILAGGEPLVRSDIVEIVEYAREQEFETISLATNGTLIKPNLARNLASFVDYIDVTIDGPRKIHNRIRGEYDAVILGIRTLKDAGIPFSIVTVLLGGNSESILYICQIADVLEAKKLKIMTPIAKGRGKNLISESLSSDELMKIFQKIRSEKEKNGWSARITLTDWNKVGEGHAILVHPDGEVVASPVPSVAECVYPIGNVTKETVELIWKRYPYKKNHLEKYIEKTLHVC